MGRFFTTCNLVFSSILTRGESKIIGNSTPRVLERAKIKDHPRTWVCPREVLDIRTPLFITSIFQPLPCSVIVTSDQFSGSATSCFNTFAVLFSVSFRIFVASSESACLTIFSISSAYSAIGAHSNFLPNWLSNPFLFCSLFAISLSICWICFFLFSISFSVAPICLSISDCLESIAIIWWNNHYLGLEDWDYVANHLYLSCIF